MPLRSHCNRPQEVSFVSPVFSILPERFCQSLPRQTAVLLSSSQKSSFLLSASFWELFYQDFLFLQFLFSLMLLFYFWEFGPSRLFLYFLSEENVLSPKMFPVLFPPVFECPPTALPCNPVPEYYGIYTCRCGSLLAVSSGLPGSSSSSVPEDSRSPADPSGHSDNPPPCGTFAPLPHISSVPSIYP